jgi:hypothetical protein
LSSHPPIDDPHPAPGFSAGWESGALVPTTGPAVYDDEPQPEAHGSTQAAFEVLRQGLAIIIEGGHTDGACTRAAALALLVGVYATPTEAAKAAKTQCSSLIRAVEKMRSELLRNKPPLV